MTQCERSWTPPLEARINESNRFREILNGKEYHVPIERLVSELTEAIILGAIERPAKYGGTGVTLYIRAMNAALVDPKNPPGLYWKVSATMTVDGKAHQWESEGEDLNAAVARTVGLIPQGLLYPDVYGRKKRSGGRRVVRRSTPSSKSTQSPGTSTPGTSPSKKRVVRRRA